MQSVCSDCSAVSVQWLQCSQCVVTVLQSLHTDCSAVSVQWLQCNQSLLILNTDLTQAFSNQLVCLIIFKISKVFLITLLLKLFFGEVSKLSTIFCILNTAKLSYCKGQYAPQRSHLKIDFYNCSMNLLQGISERKPYFICLLTTSNSIWNPFERHFREN